MQFFIFLFRAFHLYDEALVVSAVIAVIYAISDEYINFCPIPEGTIRDVFIDSIGVSCLSLSQAKI